MNLTTTPAPHVPLVSDQTVTVVVTIVNGFFGQGLCIFGSLVNVINMIIFAKLGFNETINLSLFSLAFSDFGACFTLIWMYFCNLKWVGDMDLPFHQHEIYYLISAWPHTFFTRITALITALIMAERCVCVTYPLKVKTIFTRRRLTVLIITAYGLIILCAIPVYYTNKYGLKFYPEINKTMVGLIESEGKSKIEAGVIPLMNALFAFAPFVFIAVTTAILVVSLRKKAAWRKTATTGSNPSDSSNKELKVARMVVLISAMFIVCNSFNTIFNPLLHTVDDLDFHTGKEKNLVMLLGPVAFIGEVINSSMNIFIYYRNSTNYRAKFNEIILRREKSKE